MGELLRQERCHRLDAPDPTRPCAYEESAHLTLHLDHQLPTYDRADRRALPSL